MTSQIDENTFKALFLDSEMSVLWGLCGFTTFELRFSTGTIIQSKRGRVKSNCHDLFLNLFIMPDNKVMFLGSNPKIAIISPNKRYMRSIGLALA